MVLAGVMFYKSMYVPYHHVFYLFQGEGMILGTFQIEDAAAAAAAAAPHLISFLVHNSL